jgi:hypothetical protein
MKKTAWIACLSLIASQLLADMGSIPFDPMAKIQEPNQRALIACNGEEEILILSTDLQADRATKVLEVMPLPSEPAVTNADAAIFGKATNLINSKLPKGDSFGAAASLSAGAAGGYSPPAAEVTFHEKIGAHDISVIHANRKDGFVKWVQDYLAKQGVGTPTIPDKLNAVIDEYIDDNFTWFVFDVVSLSDKPVTKEAIQFRFKTSFLYYPMRITRTEEGDTDVRLLVLTRELFHEYYCLGLPRKDMELAHHPVTITGQELEALSVDIYRMLGKPETIKLRTWSYAGKLDSFNDDVIYGDPRKFIAHIRGKTATPASAAAQEDPGTDE